MVRSWLRPDFLPNMLRYRFLEMPGLCLGAIWLKPVLPGCWAALIFPTKFSPHWLATLDNSAGSRTELSSVVSSCRIASAACRICRREAHRSNQFFSQIGNEGMARFAINTKCAGSASSRAFYSVGGNFNMSNRQASRCQSTSTAMLAAIWRRADVACMAPVKFS